MRDHLVSQPGMDKHPLKSLALVGSWTGHHKNNTGTCFLDSFLDFEAYIWNVLGLFEDVETITIYLPEFRQNVNIFAGVLQQCIFLTINANQRAYSCCKNNTTNQWIYWGDIQKHNGQLALSGKNLKGDRVVMINCQLASRFRGLPNVFDSVGV